MASLAKFSIVGLAAIGIIIVCVLSVAPTLAIEEKGVDDIVLIKVGGLGTAMCMLCFAYLCQHSVLLNYHQMKDKSVMVFKKVRVFCDNSYLGDWNCCWAYISIDYCCRYGLSRV
jgi:hypothetical protein